jgi:predicted dienelactone hydrolase
MRIALWIGLAALTAWAIDAQAAPTICDGIWHDDARGRDVPVRVRMPEGMRRVPVILFSHGLGGSVDAGTAWAEAWADAGFAVIHLQHPGSDLAMLRAEGRAGARGAATGQQLVARGRDVSFVIDQLALRPAEGACDLRRIDRARIGMSGHSFGAQTTLAVAGQSFGSRGPALRDPPIRAAIAFSPAPPVGAGAAEISRAFGSVSLPMLMITGTQDASPLGRAVTPADRQKPFGALAPGNKFLLVFDGADHMAFGGFLRRQATANDLRITSLVRLATTAFWRATLNGDGAAAAALSEGNAVERSLAPGDRIQRR